MNDSINNSKKKILVAEDDVNLLEMVVMVLNDEGYQVDAASNGKEAWDLMESNLYQLLVTDLYMPEMNGFELIQACQKSFPETKTILMSGGGRDFEAENESKLVKLKGQEMRVDTFLKKPCNLSKLINTVEKLLQD